MSFLWFVSSLMTTKLDVVKMERGKLVRSSQRRTLMHVCAGDSCQLAWHREMHTWTCRELRFLECFVKKKSEVE